MKSNVRPGVRVKQQRCAELLGEPRKAFRKLVQDCVPVNDAARWCNLKLVPVRIKLRVPDAELLRFELILQRNQNILRLAR